MSNTKKLQKQRIREEIDRLHNRGNSNFQTLLGQVKQNRKKVELNLPQLVASMSKAPFLCLEWGRGLGKTTMRGVRWGRILEEMPRSTGLFIGPSYQFILTRIVPSLVQGLEMFGIYKDLHYFVGRQPPRSWRSSWGKAYQPPDNYTRYITFWNGVGVHLISHDVPGDGRGLNADWVDGDEAALLKASYLQENTDPTLRGTNKFAFQKSSFFGSRFYTSSTPLSTMGEWFLNYETKAIEEPQKYNFISATCQHNMHNLREGYLEEAKANAYADWVYRAEYLNIRPRFSKNNFYPLFDTDIHTYTKYNYSHYVQIGSSIDCRGDGDLIAGLPLILGIDWGASINCLTVNQYAQSIREYRTLKSMYVLGDQKQIQDDLFQNFHSYYQYHNIREAHLWYDNSGNNRTGNTRRTRAEQAAKQLRDLGWRVHLKTVGGTNPQHEQKHILWNALLKGDHPRLPIYRVNRYNCKELLLSMKAAKTKTGSNGETQKDKSSERNKNLPRQHATDLSDANDTPVFGMFRQLLQSNIISLPNSEIHTM